MQAASEGFRWLPAYFLAHGNGLKRIRKKKEQTADEPGSVPQKKTAVSVIYLQ